MANNDKSRTLYLDHKGSNATWDWLYYTVKGGTEVGDTIEVTLVNFPKFEAYGDTVSTPGNVGLIAAEKNIDILLRNKWGIERERSVMIGVLVD